MSVNVNTVYQRVLALTNKEQRGFITPQEFNFMAAQAQLDIFEQYFFDLNQFLRLPGNSLEYSDMVNILEEKISLFEKVNATVTSGVTLPTDLYRLGGIFYNGKEAEKVSQKDISISLTSNAKEFVSQAGFDPVYGARPLKRAIYEIVEDRLADLILEDKILEGSSVEFDVQNGNVITNIS